MIAWGILAWVGLALAACQPAVPFALIRTPLATATPAPEALGPADFAPRPAYSPGELVDYTAQPGDALPALAARFNTTVNEILAANPFIPADASTMPPGMPMSIPIYYLPFWGTPYQMLPGSLFVNGPAQVGFDVEAFVAGQPGWLNGYTAYVAGQTRSGAGIVAYVAQNFSVSPRLLLALLEFQTGALTGPARPANLDANLLGYAHKNSHGLYLQLVWAANKLNNGYYGWRAGALLDLYLLDGTLEHPDPWQNAATVALQAHFAGLLSPEAYAHAIGPEGFAAAYREAFGDPWAGDQPHIPGSLRQPRLQLPFELRRTWAYTGGPHTGWGTGLPFAALDFAPPSEASGCVPSNEWATAMAAGLVVRSETGVVVVDLDLDGDERTGWVLFYLHVGTDGRAPVGAVLEEGQPVGHPSCEGGTSTGSHVHVARKYNGEWIAADGPVPFDLGGWVARNGSQAYQGILTNFSRTVYACECANQASHIRREGP